MPPARAAAALQAMLYVRTAPTSLPKYGVTEMVTLGRGRAPRDMASKVVADMVNVVGEMDIIPEAVQETVTTCTR